MGNKGFDMELFFAALADRTRLRLINLMGADELCVCFFVEVLKTNQPKISRHLAYLRRAGLVSDRKDGKWVHYRVAEPSDTNAARILREVLTWLRDDPEMRRDRERLARVCCAPQPPVSIQGAPRPVSFTAWERVRHASCLSTLSEFSDT
jgi:ArsR family transcriptional regulator, arsenate/arsenite/antimonite-responsive transcriptional repressor